MPPPAKPAKPQEQPPTLTEMFLWLQRQAEWRDAADAENVDDGRGRHYAADLRCIRRLMRLVEVVQFLGAQFTALCERNKEMLAGKKAVPVPPAPPPPVEDEELDDDAERAAPDATA